MINISSKIKSTEIILTFINSAQNFSQIIYQKLNLRQKKISNELRGTLLFVNPI